MLSLPLSFWLSLAAAFAVAGRSASARITMPLPSTCNADFGVGQRDDETPSALRGKAATRARLAEAKARLQNQDRAREQAHQEHLERRARAEAEQGKKLRGAKPRPPQPDPKAKVNTSDPQSRTLKGRHGYLQGYNAQAVVSTDQVVVGADVVDGANDVAYLHSRITQAQANLYEAGVQEPIEVVVAEELNSPRRPTRQVARNDT